jgi:hypothetical protein
MARNAIAWPVAVALVAVVFVVGLLARVPDEGGLVALLRDDEPSPLEPPMIRWQAPELRLVLWRATDRGELTLSRRI